jgi:Ser/Thr protein kinase RdoA (MazF antagonist)
VTAPPDWLHTVAAAYGTGADTLTTRDVTVHRVRGGANNALYQVETNGQCYACKLCVPDERDRAVREYGALCLLHAAGQDIAPAPLWLDESCSILPFPAVAYVWLHGAPLTAPLTAQQLAALLDTYRRLHSLRPEYHVGHSLPHAFFHWFDFAPYLRDLRSFLDDYGTWLAASVPDGRSLRDRLRLLVDGCAEVISVATVDPGDGRFPLRLCRVDPNLQNVVWGIDGRARWVDWEYSGWGDPALDLAELRWHAALAVLSEEQHGWVRVNYPQPVDDACFEERLVVWDHILASRWPLLILRALWCAHNGSDRVRLTRPETDPDELRDRLVHLLERAEGFAGS